LYDLLAYRSIERLSIRAASATLAEDLPPLPNSPGASPLSPPPEPIQEECPEPVAQSASMPPKKAARDADADEQYGAWCNRHLLIENNLANVTVQAPFTPSQGM
jgi:hypothetical protein